MNLLLNELREQKSCVKINHVVSPEEIIHKKVQKTGNCRKDEGFVKISGKAF